MNYTTTPVGPVETALDFNTKSGSLTERLLFNNRPIVLIICILLTAFLGWMSLDTRISVSLERLIPTQHPYLVNFFAHYSDLQRQGNAVRIIAVAKNGTILNKNYLDNLQKLDRDISVLPGVDPGNLLSLWSPNVRWTAVTEDGFTGGPVMPDFAIGDANEALSGLTNNVGRSGIVGTLVSQDFKSSIIYAPLHDRIGPDQHLLDYGALTSSLNALKVKYKPLGIDVRVTGFAQVAGTMINATARMLMFFAISVTISALFLFFYTRSLSSTLLVVLCSCIASLWQVGLVAVLGWQLDPYTILVPFLIFAIGMSHGAQKMNGIMQDIGRGMDKLVAARMTFRRLFLTGFTALVCDAVGFAVLYIIQIQAIRQLAVIASLGVAILIFTNLILLPILLSYVGVNRRAADRALHAELHAHDERHLLWDFLCLFTQKRYAIIAIAISLVLTGIAVHIRTRLQVGDLDRGAPELRANSIYNNDDFYLTTHYGTSTDVLVVMVTMPEGRCNSYQTIRTLDTLEWAARQIPGVETTQSLASRLRNLFMAFNEQNPRWLEIQQNQFTLNSIYLAGTQDMVNRSCSLDPIYLYLTDHKATTLTTVTQQLTQLIAKIHEPGVKVLLAGGPAGIEAATNDVVAHAMDRMLFWVYLAVSILSLIALRSIRAVICAILPLMVTSVMAEALMVKLGIGVKVATLPVAALGVGIGVDYALYVLAIVIAMERTGQPLPVAFRGALTFTGRVVLLTGLTLAAAVSTWAFAPIKFQADMGLLLAFMFLWNMIGALILLPALATFLLPSVKMKVKA
ncbi:MAG: efflux RND transporter permease subunit [Janthinobacterium lividum]